MATFYRAISPRLLRVRRAGLGDRQIEVFKLHYIQYEVYPTVYVTV
jgi:hypothetical protein